MKIKPTEEDLCKTEMKSTEERLKELDLLYERARHVAVDMIGYPTNEEDAFIIENATPMQAINNLEEYIRKIEKVKTGVRTEKPNIALLFQAVRKFNYQTKSNSEIEFEKDLEELGIADCFNWRDIKDEEEEKGDINKT